MHEWLLGNNDAVNWCRLLIDVVHLWDDVVDRDKVIDETVANEVFIALLAGNNKFYNANRDALNALILNGYFQWQAANVFEREKREVEKAWMLRAALYQVFVFCAFLVGGQKHAEAIAPSIFEFYGEKLEDFQKEVLNNA